MRRRLERSVPWPERLRGADSTAARLKAFVRLWLCFRRRAGERSPLARPPTGRAGGGGDGSFWQAAHMRDYIVCCFRCDLYYVVFWYVQGRQICFYCTDCRLAPHRRHTADLSSCVVCVLWQFATSPCVRVCPVCARGSSSFAYCAVRASRVGCGGCVVCGLALYAYIISHISYIYIYILSGSLEGVISEVRIASKWS